MNRSGLFNKIQAVIAFLRAFVAMLAKLPQAQKTAPSAEEGDIPRSRVARLEPRRLPPMRGD